MPSHTPWIRLIFGLAVVFLLFEGMAVALGSDRGQAGALIGAMVVLATLGVEVFLFRRPVKDAIREIGLGRPKPRAMLAATGVCLALLAVLPIFCTLRGTQLSLYPGWAWLLPGLFAQAGIAEEVLFRGYLFRRVRADQKFWPAATLSMLPFTAVHLLLLFEMPWPAAAAATLLAVVISFPLSYLFELGGRTIWGPAVLHFVVQCIKMVAAPTEEMTTALAVTWMAAAAILPWAVFLVPTPVGPSSSWAITENRR